MLCGDIMRQQGIITDAEWNYLLRGSGGMDKVNRFGLPVSQNQSPPKKKQRTNQNRKK